MVGGNQTRCGCYGKLKKYSRIPVQKVMQFFVLHVNGKSYACSTQKVRGKKEETLIARERDKVKSKGHMQINE